MIYQKHCPGCYGEKKGVAVCPFCGYDESAERSSLFLPHGVIIGGQYRVGRVLGRPGGFGITYIGWDVHLQQRVAIKEFLPRDQAGRNAPALEVMVHDGADKASFESGKEQFLREARIVAKLDHPNVVRVRNFFKDNGTAYLVMDYYEGMSLGDYLTNVRTQINAEIAVPLIRPIIDALEYVHERGVVHRDLKPHNIYLAAIGKPILLDFGAARQAAAGGRVHSLSVVLTEGYAPLEQYQRRASQGPHTDVYGAAATLYRMITGVAPPIALDRLGQEDGAGLDYAMVPEALRPVLARGLAVRPQDRYASAAEFGAELDRWRAQAAAAPSAEKPEAAPPPEESRRAGERRQADRRDFPRTELLPADPDSVLTNPSPDDPDTVMDTALVRRWGLPVLASVLVIAMAATLIAKIDWGGSAPARTYVAEGLPATSPAIRPTAPGPAADAPTPRATTPPPAAEFPAVAPAPAPPQAADTGPPPTEPSMIVPPGARAAIGATEVTVGEFALFVERTGYANPAWLNYPCESAGGRLPDWERPGHEQGADHPVVCVSRTDALAYAAWLARATGKPYRLPTEAEWEYAARGGSSSAYWWGPGDADGRAVCRGCSAGALNSPVAARMRPANPYGLHEIAGNVREWTCSAFEPPAPDRCTDSMAAGVVRGGSWHQGIETLRSSAREALDPQRRDVWTGFRLALGSE